MSKASQMPWIEAWMCQAKPALCPTAPAMVRGINTDTSFPCRPLPTTFVRLLSHAPGMPPSCERLRQHCRCSIFIERHEQHPINALHIHDRSERASRIVVVFFALGTGDRMQAVGSETRGKQCEGCLPEPARHASSCSSHVVVCESEGVASVAPWAMTGGLLAQVFAAAPFGSQPRVAESHDHFARLSVR